jgi:choline-sulfatase
MLGRISMIDRYCSRILEALRDSGLEQDTIVLYASDHGDMMGEHGLWFKGTAYESSVRVPLIIKGPDLPTTRVSEPVSLLDLGPTLCGLCEIDPVYPKSDGRDLSGGIKTGSFKNGGEAIVEFYGDGTWRGWRMIRSAEWKLIHVPHTEEVLYNLNQDPGEWQNVADDPAHRQIRDELSSRLKQGWDPELCDERRWQSQERRMAILASLGRGEPRAWQQPSAPIPHPNPAYRSDKEGPFQFSFSAK